jgi:hypothetical protein
MQTVGSGVARGLALAASAFYALEMKMAYIVDVLPLQTPPNYHCVLFACPCLLRGWMRSLKLQTPNWRAADKSAPGRIKPTCSGSTSITMPRSYPGSELTIEQLVHALAQALNQNSPSKR